MSDSAPNVTAEGRKISGRAVEFTLTPPQWAELRKLLFEDGWTYARIRKHFVEAHGLQLTASALHRIWDQEQDRRQREQARLVKSQEAGATAREFVEMARANAPYLTEAALAAAGEVAFNMARGEKVEVRDLASLLSQLLKAKDQALDERRLILLEKKAAQAEATEKVVTAADLSPEERAQRIREIYGRA